MSKTILKNKTGEILDLDGAHVLVSDSSGNDANLNQELATLRSTISGLMAASDAMIFKGILSADKPLPTDSYQTGWTYKVGAAGTFAGANCEIGDMVICVSDFSETAKDTDWQVLQTNIDGAVTGPQSAVAGDLAAFDGATGRVISDSNVKVEDAADAIAKKHSHANAEVVNALNKDDSGNLTFDGKTINDGMVDCAVITAGQDIPANLRENGIIFEIQPA